ncbi:hypothetical protein HZC27_01565 [Candidatus Roizmanbacteria bacterium]|nr:hypothetical protein [Candidatus Roizmanbacteria bacterium]
MVAGLGSPDAGRAPVARAEVVASFGKVVVGTPVDAARVAEANRLLLLRSTQPQEQGNWGRNAVDRISAQRNGERWSVNMADEDKKAFKDKTTSKEATAKIEQAKITMAALEIFNLPAGAQRNARLIEMQKNGSILKTMTAPQLEKAAVTILATDPYIAEMFQDIPVSDRQDFIKATLLSGNISQELQRSLAQRMGEAHALILGLPQTQTESEELQTQLDQAKSLRKVAQERCEKIIEQRKGPPKLTSAQKTRLDMALQTQDASRRWYDVSGAIGEALGIPQANIIKVNEHVSNEDRVKQLDADMLALNNKSAEYKAKNTEKTKLVARNVVLACTPADIPLYRQAVQMTKEAGFKAAEATYVAQNTQINTLELQVLASAGSQISYERFSAENEALGKLDSVFGEAMADVMQVQEDKIREAKVIEQQAKEKAAEGQNKTDLMQLHATENKRWIEGSLDKRNDVVHLDNISNDSRFLAYHGEQGERILIARDAGILTPADFTAFLASGQTPEQFLAVKFAATPGLESRFNAIYTPEQAKEYRENLMSKYFTAERFIKQGGIARLGRGVKLEGNKGSFKLRENEWARLYTHFEGEVNDALGKSNEAKQFLDSLKAQGIVAEPKLKWLLYALLILLGIGGGLTSGGLAIPALGVGGAALAGGGVGTALTGAGLGISNS